MLQSAGVTTTQNFAQPPFTLAGITSRGETAKTLGALSYKIIDNGNSFTLEITWPPAADPGGDGGNPGAEGAALAAPAGPAATGARAGDVAQPDHGLDFGQKLVEHWEGCSLTPYHGGADRPDVWTIGWGCIAIKGQPVTAATPAITQDAADALLEEALAIAQQGVDDIVTVELTDYQEAALISFAYNEGLSSLKTSTLLTLLNGGHVTEAAAQFARWVISNGVRVNGLIKRRGAEAAVFLGKVPYGPNMGAVMDQYANAALAAATNPSPGA